MIKTVADLMAAFLEAERKILDEDPVEHAPTIGAMYEGLTKDALEQTVPRGLVVSSGFAVNAKGEQSGQLDCILAKGAGEPVPRTDLSRFRIEDIIAVVEVKKTLYGDDLAEGYDQLREVYKLGVAIGTPVPPVARRAFEQITGIVAYSESEVPEELSILWALLRNEAATPARVLLGFHGYQNETNLRRGVLKWLPGLVGEKRSGPMSLPHLICNQHSVVVKANGMPWPGAMQGDKWPCLLSSDTLSPANAFLGAA